MTYCPPLFERLEKEIDSGKTLDQIANKMCPGVKHPRRKIINMVKIWQGEDYQGYLTKHETLKYHHKKVRTKKSDKKSPQNEETSDEEEEEQAKDNDEEENEEEEIEPKVVSPTPKDKFKRIVKDYKGGAGLNKYLHRYLAIHSLVNNTELFKNLVLFSSLYPDQWQTTIEQYFKEREFMEKLVRESEREFEREFERIEWNAKYSE